MASPVRPVAFSRYAAQIILAGNAVAAPALWMAHPAHAAWSCWPTSVMLSKMRVESILNLLPNRWCRSPGGTVRHELLTPETSNRILSFSAPVAALKPRR